jgi:hypothetical protein
MNTIGLHIIATSYCRIQCCMLESMHRRTDKFVTPCTEKAVQFTNHTKFSDWKSVAQLRKIARLCAIIKAYCGERTWKAIRDSLRRAYSVSRVDHVRKIMDGKQRT